ncbi:epimerase [Cellulomonas soli]|uniref:epimerase n=1 Tax=Cellulomonas soli TaxID=931535 RepID=UPI003F86393F
MKVVVAGGSGALGRALCGSLASAGHDVVVLTRRPRQSPYRQVVWDGATAGPWAHELDGSAVVNLAGELVDRRPTAANVALLTRSRVDPTRALVEAAEQVRRAPRVWVQASTLAIHGDAGEALVTESSPPGDGPPQMVDVARAWEAAAAGARTDRQVVLRTSIVLDRGTPALDRLVGLTRAGLGGRVGSGQQWFSWIHVADWLRVVHWSLGLGADPTGGAADRDIDPLGLPTAPPPRGVLVATAPQPVRNHELMRILRTTLHRPAAPPTPTWLVRAGSVLLRTDPALGLTGRRAVSTTLREAGLTFRHPELGEALRDLLHRP